MYKALPPNLTKNTLHALSAACDVSLLPSRFYEPKLGRFTSFDVFEAPPDDPTGLHKYSYANANPVMNVDPSGQFTLPELGIRALLGAILVAIVYGSYKGVAHYFAAPKAMTDSTPMDDTVVKDGVDYLIKHAGNHPMVHRLRNSYYPVQGFFVRKLPKNSYAEGVTRPNDTTIYIGEDALKDGVAATALEIFGEFQHSGPGGGRFDGPDVQKELEEVRRMFPKKDRTLFVDAIHHGGQINHLP